MDRKYRPLTNNEVEETKEKIRLAKVRIRQAEIYISELNSRLEKGWPIINIDFSLLPKPKPDCYLCKFATAIRTCSLKYTYGTACEHYKYFREGR